MISSTLSDELMLFSKKGKRPIENMGSNWFLQSKLFKIVLYTANVVLWTPAGRLGFKHWANRLANCILWGRLLCFFAASIGDNLDSQLPISAHYLFLSKSLRRDDICRPRCSKYNYSYHIIFVVFMISAWWCVKINYNIIYSY